MNNLETKVQKGNVNSRIVWIDISRAIAIIAVIVGHSLGNYWLGYLARIIFAFHMPIFFILSGYLYKSKSIKTVFKKGIINLVVPYLGTVMIEVVILFLCKSMVNPILYSRLGSFKNIVLSASYGVGTNVPLPFNKTILSIGAIWFLLAMFFGSHIFNLVMKLDFKQNDLLLKGIIIIFLTFLGFLESVKYLV